MKKLNSLVLVVVLFSLNLSVAFARQTPTLEESPYIVDPSSSCHNQVESRYMRSVRKDRHIPCDCKPFNLHQFKGQVNYYVQGIKSTKGADQKLNLTREEARNLWRAFDEKNNSGLRQQLIEEMSKDSRLLEFINTLEENKEIQGFKFSSEGDVLEALAIAEKEKTYAPPTFFVTGGVSYGKDKVMGELDIIVFERLTCSAIIVGEAKLGKGVSQAREQLSRFRSFVNKH